LLFYNLPICRQCSGLQKTTDILFTAVFPFSLPVLALPLKKDGKSGFFETAVT